MIIDLYKINFGSQTLFLNSTNRDLLISGSLYYGAGIEREDITYDLKETMGDFSIGIPQRKAGALKNYVLFCQGGVTDIEIVEYNIDLGGSTNIYKGVADSFSLDDMTLSIHFKSRKELIKNVRNRAVVAPGCNLSLYGGRCGVDKDDFSATGEITSIDGVTLQCTNVAGYAAGYFSLGTIEVGDEFRHINSHSGAEVILMMPFSPNVEVTDTFVAYAGCDHTIACCRDRFSNFPEGFLGFPYAPLEESVYIGEKGYTDQSGGKK